jgi:chromosome segregation ATPase
MNTQTATYYGRSPEYKIEAVKRRITSLLERREELEKKIRITQAEIAGLEVQFNTLGDELRMRQAEWESIKPPLDEGGAFDVARENERLSKFVSSFSGKRNSITQDIIFRKSDLASWKTQIDVLDGMVIPLDSELAVLEGEKEAERT